MVRQIEDDNSTICKSGSLKPDANLYDDAQKSLSMNGQQKMEFPREKSEKGKEPDSRWLMVDESMRLLEEKDLQIASHKAEIEKHAWQMVTKDMRIKELYARIENQASRINEIADELDKCKNSNLRLNLQLKHENEQYDALRSKFKQLTPTNNSDYDVCSPNHIELKMLQEKLSVASEDCQKFKQQLETTNMELNIMKQQQSALEARKISASYNEPASISADIFGSPVSSDKGYIEELSQDVMKSSKKLWRLSTELKESVRQNSALSIREKHLIEELKKIGEEVWLAKERVVNQDRELSALCYENTKLKDEIAQLQDKEYWKTADNRNGVSERTELEIRSMREHYEKCEWFLGETKAKLSHMEYLYGDAEARRINAQYELDQARIQNGFLLNELNQLRQLKDLTNISMKNTFLIRRNAMNDREKWKLAMWTTDHSPHDISEYKRVNLGISAPSAGMVMVLGSFVNWECALICNRVWETDTFDISIDLPRGYYEFVFMVDGKWKTSDRFEIACNSFGKPNNLIHVE